MPWTDSDDMVVTDADMRFGANDRAILFIDVVDSVRLIETDEAGAIERWRSLVSIAASTIFPENHGVIKKSLGDGLLAYFPTAPDAARAALAIHAASKSQVVPNGAERLHLRAGIDLSSVIEDDLDIYGHGVNVAARLITLAKPGETVISINVKEQLIFGFDADIEDMGPCFLKNVSEPVRAFRIGKPDQDAPRPSAPPADQILPRIAVIPFAEAGDAGHPVLGSITADEITDALSRSPYLRVISRLSANAFTGRKISLTNLRHAISADLILSGSYVASPDAIRLSLELADTESLNVIWAEQRTIPLDTLLSLGQDSLVEITSKVHAAILGNELEKVRRAALPNLQSYSLLLASISLMHRMSLKDFLKAGELLEAVIDRWQHEPVPRSWLAQWYVLRAQQGWSDDPDRDSFLALDSARQALDIDPNSSLALTIDGLVHTHMLKDHNTAVDRYSHAVRSNPSNALAWALKGAQHAFTDQGTPAVEATERAIQLSPLDPQRYYYDTLAATAYLSAGRFEEALTAAEQSLRANRTHTSTWRAKAIALQCLGRDAEAQAAGKTLLELEPGLTVSGWRMRSPASGYRIGAEWADTLREVGVPA